MAQEVGVAYVTLLPSGRGFGKSVEGQVDDALSKSEKKTNGFFSKVGTGIKRVGLGIAAVAGTVATLAVTGGISRALNIEDAQAKLKGLGHDAKSVETIMTDALASVKGTAFGLDAAATTAASAVASGIKPGKQLEGYLRLTADAATIAGVSMEEMGSIINKVQAKGKAQMEDLNRLTERGIPIMQMLADEYGVTADEMSDMVSRGEVDSERFRRALEKNVGGAALASGDTTRGAFANMRAALSRLGLIFVGPALEHAKTFFNEVTVILDGLGERFGPWVEKINGKLSELLNPDGLGDRFLAAFDRFVTSFEQGPIPRLLEALAPVLPALGEAAQIIGSSLGDAIAEIGRELGPELPEIAQKLADAVVELAPALADLLVALVPVIPALAELLAALSPLLTEAIESSAPYVSDFTRGLEELISLISGEVDTESFVESINSLNGPLGEANRSAFDTALQFGFLGGHVIGAGELLTRAIQGILADIGMFIGSVVMSLQLLAMSFQSRFEEIKNTISNAWLVITVTVQNGVNSAVAWIQTLPGRVQAALSDAGSWLVETGKNIIRGLIQGVSSMIGDAIASVQSVGAEMVAGVQSVLGIHSPSRVFRDEVGKMVGLGLLEGIEDRAVAGRINTAVNHLVEIPSLAGAGGGGASYVQNNSFEHLDPQVAIELSDRRFDSFVRGAL